MNQSLDEGAVSVLSAFFESSPTLRGTSSDQNHARQMVVAPPLPPSVFEMNGTDVLRGLEQVHGSENLDEAFLFGDADSIERAGTCEIVSYEGLLSGGVSACIDAEARAVIAIWLTPEG